MEELEHTIASAVLFTLAVVVGVILGFSAKDDLPAAAPAPAAPAAVSK